MEILKDIFVIILLVSASSLCWYLIKYLKEITGSVKSIERDINELSEQIKPVLEKVDKASSNIEKLSSELRMKTEEVITYTDDIIGKVKNFSISKAVPGNNNPIGNLISNLTAFTKGVTTFWTKLRE